MKTVIILSLLLLAVVFQVNLVKAQDEDDAVLFGTEQCRSAPELCVAIPDSCRYASEVPCIALAVVQQQGNISTYNFTFSATHQFEYAALGFSDDNKMGNEVVVDCYKDVNTIYWTMSPAYNAKVPEHHLYDKYVRNFHYDTRYTSDYYFYCQFQIEHEITVGSYMAKLHSNNSYYLLLAAGPLKDGIPAHHTEKIVLDNPIQFNSASSMSVIKFLFLSALIAELFL